LNIVQINDNDLAGRRFNGYDLNKKLNSMEHLANQFVMRKASDDPTVIPLQKDQFQFCRSTMIDFEKRLSMNGLAFPTGRILMEHPKFKEAHIVHYHLIHNYLLSLLDFPDLSHAKPSVWTLHDPWAFTGHCVHPMECEGWKKGCTPCLRIHEFFTMRHDKAGQMWNIKKQVYQKMDIDIVVSSQFMEDLVHNSPLTSHFQHVHRIQFGIQIENFEKATRESARMRWQISNQDFVIAFRSEQNEFKGSKYILDMLKNLEVSVPVTVLAIGFESLPSYLKKQYRVIELGWQDNLDILYDFYAACDVFLMPSIAEAFGLMAVEAMASSRPVIVFEGTALPSVTFAPDCGIAVPYKSSDGLKVAIEHLMQNQEECLWRGEKGRELAKKHYRFEDYVARHIALYEEILNRKR
jgi:glycosyltransferase involved in cell wall biosynthesis